MCHLPLASQLYTPRNWAQCGQGTKPWTFKRRNFDNEYVRHTWGYSVYMQVKVGENIYCWEAGALCSGFIFIQRAHQEPERLATLQQGMLQQYLFNVPPYMRVHSRCCLPLPWHLHNGVKKQKSSKVAFSFSIDISITFLQLIDWLNCAKKHTAYCEWTNSNPPRWPFLIQWHLDNGMNK